MGFGIEMKLPKLQAHVEQLCARHEILRHETKGPHYARKLDQIKEEQYVVFGNLADVEIWRASIEANSIHGEQLSVAEKKKEAIKGWGMQAHLPIAERIADLAKLFGVSRDAVERWTKDARAEEKRAVQDRAYDLWLDCYSQRDIAEIIGREYPAFEGVTHPTIAEWTGKKSASAENLPPGSRQHFVPLSRTTCARTCSTVRPLPSSNARTSAGHNHCGAAWISTSFAK
jgi:hypothetical protein